MKKIKFLIIFCVILLIGIISFLLFNPELKANDDLEEILISTQMPDDLILPKGLYKLGAVYKGNLSTENICKSYNYLATEIIPKYYLKCKDLNSEEIRKIYEKNKDVIYIELGYQNYEEFLNLVTECKKLKGKKLIFESYALNGLSIEENNDSFSIYLSIKYKDNDEIVFNTYVLKNKSKDSISIILKNNVDLDSLKEKELQKNSNTIDNSNNVVNKLVEEVEIPKSGRAL